MMYEWFKVIHILAVISWMAGMLYLPRLFVYHAETEIGSQQSETFKIMERRLLKAIMSPAMGVSWIFGGLMIWQGGWMTEGWMHGKLLLVILMSACHGYLSKQVKIFAADQNQKKSKHFRIVNEIPTLLMIFIVILVVIKPF